MTTTATPGLVRLTVLLTARAWAALTSASKLTLVSKPDTINRAVLLYDRIAQAEPGAVISFQRRRGELVLLTVTVPKAKDKR